MGFLDLAATALISMAMPHWQFKAGYEDGHELCAISQLYRDGTRITIMVNDATARDNLFLVGAENGNWSTNEGENLGQISLNSASYHMGSDGVGTGRGFYIVGALGVLDRLLSSIDATGFTILRLPKKIEVGHYEAGDIQTVLAKLRSCLREKLDKSKDPFAR